MFVQFPGLLDSPFSREHLLSLNLSPFFYRVDPYDPYFHYMTNTKIRKTPPPHGLKMCKGPRNVILNRTVADFMVNHPVSRDLLEWMRTMLIPEEGFYSTLIRARVSQLQNGSYAVTQDLEVSLIKINFLPHLLHRGHFSGGHDRAHLPAVRALEGPQRDQRGHGTSDL